MTKKVYINGQPTHIEIRDEPPVRYYSNPGHPAEIIFGWAMWIGLIFLDKFLGWPIAGWFWFIMKLTAFVVTGGMFWSSLEAFGI